MTCSGPVLIFWAFLQCQQAAPPPPAATFCDVLNSSGGPVLWSRNDTRETKARIDKINAAGVRLCGWGAK